MNNIEFDPKCATSPQCRICGEAHASLFVSVWGKYEYYECENCGAIFLYNLPNVKAMYSGNETMNAADYIDDAVYEQRVETISAPKVQFVLDVCKQTGISINQWLDVGCGGGEILRYLQKSNIIGVGIESDVNECIFAANKGLNVYNYFIDIEKNNETINKLIAESDVVSFINVIEHIENPVEFVKYISKRMHKGAMLVFEVPRHPSVASFANQTCDHAVYRHIVSPIHLQVFSENSLSYLLEDRFSIVGKWEFGQGYGDLLNNAMIVSGLEESALYIELMNLSNKIQPVFDEAGFADQMLIVAQRN